MYWTFEYLFGDDERSNVSLCSNFVCTRNETLAEKVSVWLGEATQEAVVSETSLTPEAELSETSLTQSAEISEASLTPEAAEFPVSPPVVSLPTQLPTPPVSLKKSATKKNKKKKENKQENKQKRRTAEMEEDAFLEGEKQRVANEKAQGRPAGCKTIFKHLTKCFEYHADESLKEAFPKLKHNMKIKTLEFFNFMLCTMFYEWTTDARVRMGTSFDSNAALTWVWEDILMGKHMTWKVRTRAQFRFMCGYISWGLEGKNDVFKWRCFLEPERGAWHIERTFSSFAISWVLNLEIVACEKLFKNPYSIPYTIGRLMVHEKEEGGIRKHFKIDSVESFTLDGDRALSVMLEMLHTIIEKKLSDDEMELFQAIVKSFSSIHIDNMLTLKWSCSRDGIFVMCGVPGKTKEKIDSSELVEDLRPFFAAVGFGGFPDYLDDTKFDSRSHTFFC